MTDGPPEGPPPYRIERCDAARREPGMMVFNVRPGGSADQTEKGGWLLGVGRAGEIVLEYRSEEPTGDTRLLANGNLLISQTDDGRLIEMTRTGEIRRHWTITGKWGGRTPPEGAIPIDLPLTHHSIGEMANGNFLLCSAELRDYADWPSSEQPAEARPEPARVVGDVIFEVTPEGAVVNQWPMLDLLDPYRLSYGSRSGYWRSRGFPDSFDWCHTNAAIHDRRDDTIIASLRTQDCMVKFDRTTGALRWILGPSANWKAPWAEKLLRPEGDVEWAYHQHDCSVTPGGNVLCFDNGNHRALPPDGKMAEAESYSRAVEFAVDEEAGTVRQVWAYGDAADEKLFASYQGGAYRLPKTGNTFITYGGVCTTGGKPSGNANSDTCVARLMEVTPEHDIVFDMWIDGTKIDPPQQLSAFRAEHVPTD